MRTFWVNGLNKMGLESGTYVLASEANERIKVLEGALEEAIGAGEYVVKIIEADGKAGVSPNGFERSMPHATLAHCYAAMSFLNQARKALEVKRG